MYGVSIYILYLSVVHYVFYTSIYLHAWCILYCLFQYFFYVITAAFILYGIDTCVHAAACDYLVHIVIHCYQIKMITLIINFNCIFEIALKHQILPKMHNFSKQFNKCNLLLATLTYHFHFILDFFLFNNLINAYDVMQLNLRLI